jgi:hypothetical protein
MPTAADVAWFKSQFQQAIVPALTGTPFSVDMITAIACQETGCIWSVLRRKGLSTERILQLCVGDSIDASATGGRRAFPKNKAELLAAPEGARMFALARQGLVDMAGFVPGYGGAAARPDKFCRGFGIFQLDLQFFRSDPSYFLEQRYADFGHALQRCVGELRAALKRIGWAGKASLSDHEMAAVAIAYNTGRYNPAKGLKQGHFDGSKYYGENFFSFLQLAHSVQVPVAVAAAPATRSRRREAGVETVPAEKVAGKAGAKKRVSRKAVARKAAPRKAAVPQKPAPAKSAAVKAAPRKPAGRAARSISA